MTSTTPPPRLPLNDPRTGLIAREWYLYLLSLQDGNSFDENLQAPVTGALPAFSIIEAQLQAFGSGPIQTPQIPRLRYGAFYSTADQTAGAINTAYAITFNTTSLSLGSYIGSPASRIYVDTAAIYAIQFSAQIINADAAAQTAWIWPRKNGTSIANSAAQITVPGGSAVVAFTGSYMLSLNANDYIDVALEVGSLLVGLNYQAATAVHPAIPSVALTIANASGT